MYQDSLHYLLANLRIFYVEIILSQTPVAKNAIHQVLFLIQLLHSLSSFWDFYLDQNAKKMQFRESIFMS